VQFPTIEQNLGIGKVTETNGVIVAAALFHFADFFNYQRYENN
jgi:hypothetical protein